MVKKSNNSGEIINGRHIISQLKPHYRSGKSKIGQDFFLPCLTYCSSYKRAVGFFSSSALVTWANILPKLVSGNKAAIKLLISPELSEADREAIEQIMDPGKREQFIQRWVSTIVLEAIKYAKQPSDTSLRMNLFLWLVATDKLELKIAIPDHVENPGMFHEKIGVFEFPWKEIVAFGGSANETISGYVRNYESIDVYRSWVDADIERVENKISEFDEAWNGQAQGLQVMPLSEDTLSYIKSIAPKSNPLDGEKRGNKESDVSISEKNKWRHQDEAITEFLKKERGILEMATGTGKTRTAINIIEKLVLSSQIRIIIVAMGGTDLLNQWRGHLNRIRETIKKSGIQITPYYHYDIYHDIEDFNVSTEYRYLLASTNKLHIALKNLDEEQAKKTIVIYDEIHNFGSTGNREKLKGLSENIRYRLGLSATPEREYDKEGTDFIQEHIGPIIYQFELKDAIERGILSPFNYHSLHFSLDEEDKMATRNVYAWAAAQKKQGIAVSKEDIWIRLAKVKKLSKQKLPLFKRYLNKHPNTLDRAVIFVEEKYYADYAKDIIQRHTNNYREFFQEDNSSVLNDFSRNRISTLIACHKISEGIDIKSIKTIILFSAARSKLETIQRIGRSLRTDKADPQKMATVIDFICDDGAQEENSDYERESWLSDLSEIRPIEGLYE